jgi:hypothetical protein
MLKPGGSFLFANFSDETVVAGYMETFMNWPLLLRTESDMRSIAQAAVEGEEASMTIWPGGNRNIIYCELTKA